MIVGKDIGGKLVELVNKVGGSDIQDFCGNLSEYRFREVGKLRKMEKDAKADELEDKIDCIEVFIEGATSVDEVCGRISRVFDDNLNPQSVIFSTIHKAKGLEADVVWILPTPRQIKKSQEEENLLYVAITRAKNQLNWVTT